MIRCNFPRSPTSYIRCPSFSWHLNHSRLFLWSLLGRSAGKGGRSSPTPELRDCLLLCIKLAHTLDGHYVP